MDPQQQLQNFFNKLHTDVTTHAQSWIPTPRKLDLESILSAATVLLGFWIASLLARRIAEAFFKAQKIDEALSRFLLRVTKFALLTLGAVTALGTLGVDVSAIVAGLGLTGLALGIALKDIVSNAVSGVMLLIFRPFRHRDCIRVADFEGTVIDIDMRYTHLLVEDKIIFVPNSLLFANAVTVTKASLSIRETRIDSSPHTIPPLTSRKLGSTRKNMLLTIAADEGESSAAA
jgi:small conductance mechanosensitive channel